MKEDMYESTNRCTMGAVDPGRTLDSAQHKRFVRETSGAIRVASSVWLGRNIPIEQAAPSEQLSAARRGYEWPHTIPPQKPRHERPQKNNSTFLKPSGAMADGVGGTFATFTSHETVNPSMHARTKPAGGSEHYRTAYMSQYGNIPPSAYVKPGSDARAAAVAIKQKQEAYQAMDSGTGGTISWVSHSREAFQGQSLRVEDRPTQIPGEMRGSLGARRLG